MPSVAGLSGGLVQGSNVKKKGHDRVPGTSMFLRVVFLHSEKVLVQPASVACGDSTCPCLLSQSETHKVRHTALGLPLSPAKPPLITGPQEFCAHGHQECKWEGKERHPYILHISPLFKGMLPCPIRLHLQDASAKIK